LLNDDNALNNGESLSEDEDETLQLDLVILSEIADFFQTFL